MEQVEETIQKVIECLKMLRKEKGYSIENMAEELQISVAAYNKIEKLNTKLTLERLLQIRQVLDISLADVFEIESKNFYHQEIKDNGIGHQEVQNLYNDNKELINKLLESKDKEIDFLKELVKDKR